MKPAWRCHLYFLGLVIGLWLMVLPNRTTACPKLCACYVPAEVHCTFRYLTVIPKPIQAHVVRINFGYNSVSRLEERDFSGLEKLELLMLHSNEIQTIHESTFNDLSSLQILKMSYNKVKSLHKNTFHGLKNLVRLHMDHNKLEFLDPGSFYGLTSLKLVHLEGNLLRQLHTDTFVTLRYIQIFKTSSIKHVYLSSNQLSSLPKDMFLYMNELEGLYINENPWTCDCNLQWLTDGSHNFKDLIKCKKDRSGPQCPLCSIPRKNKGKSLTDISSQDLNCIKPTIENIYKIKNITTAEDIGFTSISAKDFVAPIGSLILNMTDNSGNEANLACSVQRPTKMSQMTLDIKAEYTTMRTTFSTFLVCSIDYDHIQKIWGILAMYSDSPMKLKKDLLLTKAPYISYKYRQYSSDDEVFTDIDAELRAEPSWLMQDSMTLQLDRTATTLSTLHIRYLSDMYLKIPKTTEKPMKGDWVMIVKTNQTKTEYSAVIGGTVEMDCHVLGEPTPVIEWVLPDGSKLRAPYVSEEGRITLTKGGKFMLKAADSFDTGVYHCIATNYLDADVLSFRITVVSTDVEEDSVNGAELTVSHGDELFLPCGSFGIPDASVSWILPDHSVLHDTSRNKIIFHNGTLKIHDVTQRDRGHFRCLAANQYGIDTLIHKVTVEDDRKIKILNEKLQLDHNEDENDDGSTNEDIEEFNIHSARGKAITQRKIPRRFQWREKVTTLEDTENGHNGVQRRTKINKRIRGNRRPFIQSSRKIDPQRWSEILERTKQNSINSKKEIQEAKILEKEEQDVERVSGEVEEASGEELLPVKETFLILTTKHPAVNILNMATSKTVTDVKTTPLQTTENYIFTLQKNTEDEITSLASTTIRDLTLGTTLEKTEQSLDTLTDIALKDIQEAPTTYSLLNSPSIDMLAQPKVSSSILYTTPTVVRTITELTPTKSNLQVNHGLTTVFNSVTTAQSVITNPTTKTPHNIVTTSPTTAEYMHPMSQPDTADQSTTIDYMYVTQQGTQSSLFTTSSYLDISSEDVMSHPPSKFSHILHNASVRPTFTPNDFSTTSQSVLMKQQTTNKYLHITSKSAPSKTHSQTHFPITMSEDISSRSPPTYSPLSSRNITNPSSYHEDNMSNTVTNPKVLLTTQTHDPGTVPILPANYDPDTTPDRMDSVSTTTANPTLREMLQSQAIPLLKSEEHRTHLPYVSSFKDGFNEGNILTFDSSTKASTKLFLSQTEIGPIYIKNTQKIISPQLPAGSTIITHQQIQIVKNVTPLEPSIRRYGRRRISGKRRIIRPERIPITRVHKYKLGTNDSKDYAHSIIDQTTISELSKYFPTTYFPHTIPNVPTTANPRSIYGKETNAPLGSTADNTNIALISTLPLKSTTQVMSTTKENTGSASPNSNGSSAILLITAPPDTDKASTSNFISSSQSAMATYSTPQEKIGTRSNIISSYKPTTLKILEDISDKLVNLDSHQTNAQHRQNIATQTPTTIPTMKNIEYIHTTTPEITTKNRAPTRMLRRKIPWHRLYGKNNLIHREIVRKLRKNTQQVSTVTTPITTTVTKPITAIPLTSPSRFAHQTTTTLNTVTSSPFIRTEGTLAPRTNTIAYLTLSSPLTPSEATTIEPTANTMLTMTIPISFSAATITKQRFLKRKRPRKKNTFSNSVFSNTWKPLPKHHISNHTKSILKPTIFKNSTLDSLESIAKTYSVTQHPQLYVSTITDEQTTPLSSVVNDILLTTNKKFSWSKNPSTSKTLSQPLSKINKLTSFLPTLIPSTYSESESNFITTTHQQDTSSKYKHVASQFNKKATTLKSGIVKSTTSPAVKRRKMTSNISDLSPISIPGTAQPLTVLAKKTTNYNLENRSQMKSDGTVTMPKNTSTELKPSTNGMPSHTLSNSEDKRGLQEIKESLETTTIGLQNLEPTSNDVPSKPKIIGGKAASFTVLANSDAFIPCEAVGNPVPMVLWTKVSSGMFVSKTRRGNKMEVFGNGTLSILSVSLNDRGQYLCVATNKHGSDRLLVTLSVITYPPKILQAKSREITVHSGSSVNIKCQTEGRPFPTITWILANETIASDSSINNRKAFVDPDGTLTIKEITIYDRGMYKCLATNIAGVDTSTVRIQVIAAPPVILETKRQTVLAFAGENLKLPCTAKGNPHPTVHWVAFDGTKVKPLHYVNAKLFLFSNGTLYIRNVASTDNGNYECIATSSTGSERRVVTLRVEQRDTIPQIIHASQKTIELNFGDKLLLNCTATGEPTPRIMWRLPSKAVVDQWHRMGNRIKVHPNGSLLIDSVTEKDSGDYLCVARNKMGEDLILMKVSVTMKPAKIIQKQHLNKQVPYGKDFKVDCKASGLPLPEITWSLPDGTILNNVLQADDSGRRKRRYVLFDNGTLYLNKVGMAEEGDYTCYAENTLGKDEMKVHIKVVTAAPRIQMNHKTLYAARATESIDLHCEAIGEPKPKIFWLLPSSDMIATSHDRYVLYENGSLTINQLILLDAGEYMCVARNPAGDDTKLLKLDVQSKPPIINGLYTNKTIIKDTALKHSRKLINCRAEGNPPLQIMWIMPDNIYLTAPYHGSRIIVHKNGTLEIRNVRPSDTAEFTCVARNDGGESMLVVQLEVVDVLRRPMFKNPFNEKMIAKPGKMAILNCFADGNPAPEISWLLPNGTRFISGQKVSKYHAGSNGTLIIYSPTKDDTGKYRCGARNIVGYIEKLIILEVGQKPTILTHPRGPIKNIIGETLSLHCLSDGIPRPSVIWTLPSGYVVDRPQVNGKYALLENGTLVIEETTIHDRGNYLCKAKNYAGEASISVPVMVVAYPPRITNKPPQNIHTRVGSAVHLNCAAIGIPKPEITWELPDLSLLSTASKGRPSGTELLHPQGTLVVQNPRSSDTGMYKCIAKNPLGTDTTTTYLKVI
ncbi:immunoglobulin superfamily member 10 [Pelobates fuscus]|uniref:immunoglobulin superfamily member 10 n=1 Tax=Pelobates fuscus TaxID=191477 RepID=UPI002FE4B0E8